jgi:hypothetical protein
LVTRHGREHRAPAPSSADLDVIRRIFDTNFFGVITAPIWSRSRPWSSGLA